MSVYTTIRGSLALALGLADRVVEAAAHDALVSRARSTGASISSERRGAA